jgi:hypothetical protein
MCGATAVVGTSDLVAAMSYAESMTREIKAVVDSETGLVYGRDEKYSADQPRDEAGRFGVSASGGGRPGKPFSVIDTHDPQGGKGMRRVSFHATAEEARTQAKKLNERNAPGKVHSASAFHMHGDLMHKHESAPAYVGHVHASGGVAKIGGARSPSGHGFAAFGPDTAPSRFV